VRVAHRKLPTLGGRSGKLRKAVRWYCVSSPNADFLKAHGLWNPPTVGDGLDPILNAFFVLHAGRTVGFGFQGLRVTEIRAILDENQVAADLRPLWFTLIMAMDQEVRAHNEEQQTDGDS